MDSVPEFVVVCDVTKVVAALDDVVSDPSVVVSEPQEGARPLHFAWSPSMSAL